MKKQSGGIVVFMCQWVPSAAADNAGILEVPYDANTTLLPVACTGRLTAGMILEAFARGAGGVLVLGCAHEECHFVSGSRRCGEVIDGTRELLPLVGIEPERLGFLLLSETGGGGFATAVSCFVAEVERVGAHAAEGRA